MSAMTPRDRIVVIVIAVVVLLGGVWFLAVSPARKQSAKAATEVSSARSQLSQARSEVAEARSAKSRYHSAYATLASVGQAVPTSPEVPSLVYALDRASNNHKVEFGSISNGASSSGGAPAPASSSGSASAAGAAAAPPFKQMPFTFAFSGSYNDLIHLLGQMERFTVQPPGGPVEVSGRLLTIQSIQLASATQPSGGSASASPSSPMTWTIGASAYVLAPTSSTSAAAPGTAPSGAAAPAGSPAGAPPAATSSAATPAVVKVGG